ncbi:hypothetical protein K7432_015960 [Basidiobolus ranarum]|uniref:Uncharacterized protein n=1 Tax=Basidiobolus ranarum TaxID=34480 RepID=A0ABR2WFJ4_9FUNG
MVIPTCTLTKDGLEMQFGTNNLGHFALTALLNPTLLASPAPQVVVVSSNAASFVGNMDFENLDCFQEYSA